jgi:probable phosphoglycerate mutase
VKKRTLTIRALVVLGLLLPMITTPSAGAIESTCDQRIPFYFVRHGESEDNVNNIATGWSQTPLTDTGRAQARRTGRYLSSTTFARFISSDLRRATQTAAIINARLQTPLEITLSENFREWNLGKFTGLSNTVAQKAMMRQLGYNMKYTQTSWSRFVSQTTMRQRLNALAAADETGETETYKEFKTRLLAGVELITSDCHAGRVLVTMHGTALVVLLKALSIETYYPAGIGNASISVAVLKQGSFYIKTIGSYQPHLW